MTEPPPAISIIIPNRNYARYIGDAIRSVSAQTLTNWECIIIDDASTDESVQIIKQHIKSDKRFRLIELPEPSGVSVARNAGLDAARGEHIAFLDSDDCFSECALETLLHLATSTHADMVGGKTITVPEYFTFSPRQNTPVPIYGFNMTDNPNDTLYIPLQESKWCWIWRRIYKRSLIGDTRFDPNFKTFGDDLCFILDISPHFKSRAECDVICVYHRVHMASICSQTHFSTDNFDWFPRYFKHIHDELLDKYSPQFWYNFSPARLNTCYWKHWSPPSVIKSTNPPDGLH